MEILIIGAILVGFMVYASTRIKRSAAAAFDEESIEMDEFSIQKPAGFLHNLNGDPAFIFEAYSKDFSKDDPKLRAGTATISRVEGMSLDDGARAMHKEGYVDRGREVIDEILYREMSNEKPDEVTHFAKLSQANNALYKLVVSASPEAAGEQWIETFIDSFRVKSSKEL